MTDDAEPPIREFADRGVLWLLESPRNLASLVQLISAEIAARLDFDRAERVNRSFVPDSLHKQEADLLYRVPFRKERGEVWIYVLVENQSKPDRTMGLRVLSYMVQLWEIQRRGFEDAKVPISKWRLFPILPIVFYSGKRRWSRPISLTELMDVPTLLAPFVPQFETLLLKLQDMPEEQLSGSALAGALRALRAADEPTTELQRVLREAVSVLERLPEEAKPEWRRALLFIYLLIQHKRPVEERSDLVEAVEEVLEARHQMEAEEVMMTGAQELISRGKREGRAEGRAEGKRELLLELLTAKFGSLTEAQQVTLDALTATQVDSLARRLLTASSLSELGL